MTSNFDWIFEIKNLWKWGRNDKYYFAMFDGFDGEGDDKKQQCEES
jgi:hypothetical protein